MAEFDFMPVEKAARIPWEMIAPFEKQAQSNHSQTLHRLAERGGLSAGEALAILDGKRWGAVPENEEARVEVNRRVAAWMVERRVSEIETLRADNARLKTELAGALRADPLKAGVDQEREISVLVDHLRKAYADLDCAYPSDNRTGQRIVDEIVAKLPAAARKRIEVEAAKDALIPLALDAAKKLGGFTHDPDECPKRYCADECCEKCDECEGRACECGVTETWLLASKIVVAHEALAKLDAAKGGA